MHTFFIKLSRFFFSFFFFCLHKNYGGSLRAASTESHTHRNLWIPFLMIKMASSVAHGCICMMTTTSPANRTCNVGLHHAFLILDIYIIVRWHLSKQGIHWPVTSDLIEVKLTDQVQAFQLDCELNFFPLPVIRALLFGTDASTGLKVNQLFLYINVLHCLFF